MPVDAILQWLQLHHASMSKVLRLHQPSIFTVQAAWQPAGVLRRLIFLDTNRKSCCSGYVVKAGERHAAVVSDSSPFTGSSSARIRGSKLGHRSRQGRAPAAATPEALRIKPAVQIMLFGVMRTKECQTVSHQHE